MSKEIPIGTLRLEQFQTNPPKPVCFHVIVDGKTVAIIPIEEVEKAVKRLNVF